MNEAQSVLTIDIKQGEFLQIPSADKQNSVLIEFLHKSGQLARLRVTAPRDVTVKKLDKPM